MKATVIKSFRDKTNFSKVYKVGEDVSKLPEARISELKQKGLVEVEKPKAAKQPKVEKPKAATVSNKISEKE